MTAPSVPLLEQNDGRSIPQLGLGIYGPDDTGAADAVATAIELGYRLIDTASLYGNETGVGEGIRRSEIDRSELYITTKLADADHGYDQTMRAFDASLDRLGLDYVDLYLIHWPLPGIDKYVQSWRALEKIQANGLALSIGVSNFQPAHVKRLADETSIMPAVNQVELHPGLPNRIVRDFNSEQGILTESWSPLGRKRVFGVPALEEIAVKHHRSVAQIVLRWHVQQGLVVIPKSVTPERLAENLAVFDFELDDGDFAVIAGLENGVRTGDDPDSYNG